MLLMIDNYDSFTYNVVQYLAELGAEVNVIRNDELSVAEIEALHVPVEPNLSAAQRRATLLFQRNLVNIVLG